MKKTSYILVALSFCLFFTSCFEDLDDNPASTRDLNDFVYRGLNAYYLYKDNVPDLANDRFTNGGYEEFITGFSSPENLFYNLLYMPETVDKFSWITNNYIQLEQFFQGNTVTNGMDFGLVEYPNNSNSVFGFVGYVMPGSNAQNSGVQRGDIFYAINGTPLNQNNFSELLRQNNYTINLATYDDNGTPEPDDDTITPNGESINLTKTSYTENPIFKTEIFEVNGTNVGYLMYNGFTRNFNSQLNTVFGEFRANNVQNVVLDLRYNPGGSVNTAILLGSMIAGQTGNVFSTEEWNNDIQATLSSESVTNRFVSNDNGTPLNILDLDKVYILATKRSASASELVINSLDPYIDVVHIGTNTAGKFQASVTLYDSPNFRRSGANPSHLYAMQPLVLKSLNAVGNTDYTNGLTPDIQISENYGNMGVLGDENELLLSVALQHIFDTTRLSQQFFEPLSVVGGKESFYPKNTGMHK